MVVDKVRYLYFLLLCIGFFLAFDLFRSHFLWDQSDPAYRDGAQFLVPGSFEIVIADGFKKLVFKKENDVWQCVEPTVCDENLLNSELSMLLVAKIERSFSVSQAQLQNYGVTDDRLSLTSLGIHNDSRGEKRLKFGDLTPDLFGQYVYDEHTSLIHIIPAYQGQNLIDLMENFPETVKY